MENIKLAGSDNTPDIDFRFNENVFSIGGMSYMEDVDGFYSGLINQLNVHLEGLNGTKVQFNFSLNYFNSSSARVVFRLFDSLDGVAGAGNDVTITWNHGDDEDLIEQGEEFGEDLEHAEFELIGGEI